MSKRTGAADIGSLEGTGVFTERAQALRDEAAAFARTIAPSTPISGALDILVKARLLSREEADVLLLPAVWTWGDIPVILERGEVADAGLEEKVRRLLGL